MIKVEGHNNLFRDEETGAILNLDINEYQSYVKMRTLKQRERNEISHLKSEVSELKTMIQQLLNDRV